MTDTFRKDMEDEHVHKLCLNDEKDTHFFAVFDGHGGQGAAQYASKQLDTAVTTHMAYSRYTYLSCCIFNHVLNYHYKQLACLK